MAATSAECLFNGTVPIFLRSSGTANGGGSQMGYGMAPLSTASSGDLGRRMEGIVVEVSFVPPFGGRRVHKLFHCL